MNISLHYGIEERRMRDNPEDSHIQRNEDGKESSHTGYIRKVCESCGVEFLVAKKVSGKYNTCGMTKCEKEITDTEQG